MLFLFILPYTSFLIEDKIIIKSKEQNLNYTFWIESYFIPTDDELVKLKGKNVDFLIPISTSILKEDIGYYYGGNESFSYEKVGEEKNIKWVDSSKIYKNCTIKIINKWENHANVLELNDGGTNDYCYVNHNYSTNLIGKIFEFWIGMNTTQSVNVIFYDSNNIIEFLAFTGYDIWCRINKTHSDIVFSNIITLNNFLHVKLYLKNDSFDLFTDNNYIGTRKYSCLYDNYKPNIIDYVSLSTTDFQSGIFYFDAIGTTGDVDYNEGENLYPYNSSKYDLTQFQNLNKIGIKYSLCLITNDYAFLDNGEKLLLLLKIIRNYNFYKTASEIFIDAEISNEIREEFTLNTIPSNNRYNNGLKSYNDMKEIVKKDGKKFGIIKGPTAPKNVDKAVRNVPFDELYYDLSVIMLYRTSENTIQKDSDYWFYQSVKREKANIFIGSSKKGYSDLRKDLTICSSLGKERIFLYEYKSFSEKYDIDDLKPYKSITIQKKCENYEYFLKFLGLECLNFLLFFYFIITN